MYQFGNFIKSHNIFFHTYMSTPPHTHTNTHTLNAFMNKMKIKEPDYVFI